MFSDFSPPHSFPKSFPFFVPQFCCCRCYLYFGIHRSFFSIARAWLLISNAILPARFASRCHFDLLWFQAFTHPMNALLQTVITEFCFSSVRLHRQQLRIVSFLPC
ncbi:hypothetical protein AB6A40_007585 [Gnathostoma spinigerum]|uniref:Uncharacterized protein n=1 Tax=Gnathostoma spinigerum TaxID=75299 RepID=A0ABD6ETU6_9BILA